MKTDRVKQSAFLCPIELEKLIRVGGYKNNNDNMVLLQRVYNCHH